jgi:hypothetical protein
MRMQYSPISLLRKVCAATLSPPNESEICLVLHRFCQASYALAGLARGCAFLLTLLSQGWCSLTRPSSSQFTSASSSLVCSTVPNSPVGFPKLAKPSTRSPGFSSESGARGWRSGGLLARSASAAAPACDRGGSGALRSLDVRLFMRLIFHYPSGLLRPFICSLTRA